MSEMIEKEIIRLIQEISEDEKILAELEEQAKMISREEYSKNRYGSKLKSRKESLNRKIQLLRSLKD